MTTPLAIGGGPTTYWYLTRSTGAVALLLLTASVALGVADVRRISTRSWPRFVIDGLHRNVSLLSVVFVALHVVTSVLDGYAPISMVAAIVPFSSSYRPFWLSLGTVAFDLMLALVITSMLRARISHGAWRYTHWLAYASWPIALVHSFGTGSDVRNAWLLWLGIACVAVVAAAVLARTLPSFAAHPLPSGLGLGAVGAFAVFLAVWLPWGPLAKDWASRAGTPASLLGHRRRARAMGGSASTGATTPFRAAAAVSLP